MAAPDGKGKVDDYWGAARRGFRNDNTMIDKMKELKQMVELKYM